MGKHSLSESTKRTWRTVYAILVGLLTFIPLFVAGVLSALPSDTPLAAKAGAIAAAVLAGVASGTKLITTLETVGAIPAWLRSGDTLTLAESTKRTLRTIYQGIVAFLASAATVLPVVMNMLPTNASWASTVAAVGAGVLAVLVIVTKILTALEDRGLIPGWLRTKDPVPAV